MSWMPVVTYLLVFGAAFFLTFCKGYFDKQKNAHGRVAYFKFRGSNDEDTIMTKKWVFNAVWLLLYSVLLYGCASQSPLENLSRDWVARPLSDLKQEMKSPDSYASRIGWKETTYRLPNGNFVFVEPVTADCSVHWEINQNGIIIGYQAKGNGCKRGGGPDNSILNTQIKSGW